MAKTIEIYTDGSCTPNPGMGTCAFIVVSDEQVVYKKNYKRADSTNNFMELSATIMALRYIKENKINSFVYLHTDSQYVQIGLTRWIEGWKKRNWRTKGKSPVANKDLWMELDTLQKELRNVHFQWVRGHNGNKWNEYVDKLCKDAY